MNSVSASCFPKENDDKQDENLYESPKGVPKMLIRAPPLAERGQNLSHYELNGTNYTQGPWAARSLTTLGRGRVLETGASGPISAGLRAGVCQIQSIYLRFPAAPDAIV